MKQSLTLRVLLGLAMLVFCWAEPIPHFGAGAAQASESSGEAPVELEVSPVRPKKTQPARARAPAAKAPAAKAPRTGAAAARAQPPRRVLPRETAPSGMPPEAETRFVEDQVIVRYRLTARRANMDALVRRLDLQHLQARTFVLAGVTVHLYRITDGSPVREVIAALQSSPSVVYAQPNYLYTLLQSAGAQGTGAQYALDKLAVVRAHALATGTGIPVAVIDSQIDVTHSEFGKASIDAFDATGEAAGDAHPHGTSIAGVIASRGTLLGIAPDVRLLGVRAFLDDENGGSTYSTTWRVATGLDHAHAAQARIVNMSFAGPADPLVGNSVAGVVRRGMIAVAAAGNDGPGAQPLYPAAYAGVIAVTAVDRDNLVYARANQGEYVALSAPGVDILVPVPSNSYQISSGTSLAAAHVSGLAALVLSRQPTLSASEVAAILLGASADLGQPGRDSVFGAGLPDAVTAIEASAAKK